MLPKAVTSPQKGEQMLTTQQIHDGMDEAREKIKAEFMARYNEWFADRINLSDHDYGWKYGWQKNEKLMSLKDNLTAVAMFQKYIYPVRDWEKMEKELGVSRQIIWALSREGFLSEQQRKWKTAYFISQKTAKEIWKEARS